MKTDPNSLSVNKPAVKKHTYGRHRANRSFKGSDCWLHSPGNAQILRQAEWDMEQVASMNGMETLENTHIQVANLPGQRKIYIWPASKTDPDALPLKRISRRLWVNLGPFLSECNLVLPVNIRERFHLAIVPDSETPPEVPNALCLDLDSPLERRTISKGKKKGASPAGGSAASNQ